MAMPLVWLGWLVFQEVSQPGSALGADPGEAVVLYLGDWAIRGLLLTLCVSPLRRLFGWPALARVRRMIGLWAFAYVCLHLLAYVVLLAGISLTEVVGDLVRRPYITVGALAFALLVPLAWTSTRGWQRRLGRRWQRLHRLVYAAMALGLLHLFWLTKDGFLDVSLYALVFALLVAERVVKRPQALPA